MLTKHKRKKTGMDREDGDLSPREDAEGETPRRHVDVLLDISEDKELEPHEFHDYSGWEEAVSGWSRAASLSCILTAQKNNGKPKCREADHLPPLCVDSTPSNADSSVTIAKLHWESHVGLADCKKSVSPNKQMDYSGPTEWPVPNATPRDTTHFLPKDKTEELLFTESPLCPYHWSPQQTVPENRYTKTQKPSHKPNNTQVSIKNIVFLPPIKPPQVNSKVSCYVCRCKKTPNINNLGETLFMLDKMSGATGTGVDILKNTYPPISPAAISFNSQTWQHNPPMFPTQSASVTKRNQLLPPPKPDTVCPTSYSMGKNISQAVVQPHMPPRYLLS